MNLKKSLLALPILSATLLAGCADSNEKYVPRPVDTLYNEAMAQFNEENYSKAAKLFEELERQHPGRDKARRAQLMSALSHYQAREFEEAIHELNTFIKLHPTDDKITYAYYLLGDSYYRQIPSIHLEQSDTRMARDKFKALVARYHNISTNHPDYKYVKAARLKIDVTNHHLASKEMQTGRYYQVRQNYGAAIKRFQEVVRSKDYQNTINTAEALHRLVECFLALGIKDEALNIARWLGHNHPGSEWYTYSFNLLKDHGLMRPTNPPSTGMIPS